MAICPNEPFACLRSMTIRLPQEAWNTLWESLEIDARSTAVAPELRRELREALDQVEYVADPPSLVQAAQDVLEWAAQMGGVRNAAEASAACNKAPCWDRLRLAVGEPLGTRQEGKRS